VKAAAGLAACLLCVPVVVAAQSGPRAAAPPVEVLSRFAFHFGAEHLSSDAPQFVWEANYGGEVDLVDYRAGRTTFYANYQVILGEEFHAFDPNQGNYILGARVSARLPGVEAALVFHHESRHLSDRFKRDPVDWNMLGVRLDRQLGWRRATFDARADVRGVVQRSFVDYEWELDAGLHGRYPLTTRLAAISDVDVRRLGVDRTHDRNAQYGARAEAGLRIEGRGAAVEFFVAAERRIDPNPLAFGTDRWVSGGFRLASR
jgi:hypothetical protein